LFLNQDEAAAMIDVVLDPSDPDSFLNRCTETLRAIQPDIQIVVTAGAHGAYGMLNEEWIHSPACKVNFASTAGAGDALIAGTLAGLISGSALVQLRSDAHSIQSALDLGVLLGSYSTTSPHTIHPNADLKALLSFARDAGKHVSFSLAETTMVLE
jgi:sugar/nucleoside kinase (ribokinase family)